MTTALLDQDARDNFIKEWTRHFSVIAPAGVGKTRALVERIVHLASSPDAVKVLPRLVVVTYSVRAAQEMQLRARAAIHTTQLPFRVKRAFEQVFFGTIHSYCLRILQRFGDRLGLTSNWTLLDETKREELWKRYLNSPELQALSEELKQREAIFKFLPIQSIYGFAQKISPGPIPEFCEMPKAKLNKLTSFQFGGHPSTKAAIERYQDRIETWKRNFMQRRGWNPLLPVPAFNAPGFIQVWHETFGPLISALEINTLGYARVLANGFLNYRLQNGLLTYEDQVRQASAVLDLQEVQARMQEEPPIILLDEAQDTDSEQFQVLMKAAGWHLEGGSSPHQTLSIVGDFQQSIYERADSRVYRAVHQEIVQSPRGSQSVFQVTFRCDEAIISFVNSTFSQVLNSEQGQCAFTPLLPRPNARQGQVYRWVCPALPEEEQARKNPQVALHIAKHLALHLREIGLGALRADSWQQVAVLCPRVSWLQEIADVFVQAGLPVQVHSSRKERADRPAHRWLSALLWIVSHPEDSFEVTGVLREIFGYSDHDIALYTEGYGDRLRLDGEHSFKLPNRSAATLSLDSTIYRLRELSLAILKLPLHQAVRELITKLQLRERLVALDIDAEKDLESLMEQVFARSSAGATLHELAQELKDALYSLADAEDEIQNASQFMTSFKAKGLEWQAVVLPFLFRGISFRSEPYPRLIKNELGQEKVVLHAPHKPYRDKNGSRPPLTPSEVLQKQGIERLLYVATTRAKHTLVLVDDQALWALAPGRASDWTSAELLGLTADGVNEQIWKALPKSPAKPDMMPKYQPAKPRFSDQQEELLFSNEEPSMDKLRPLRWADVTPAVLRSREIPKRITPHSLAQSQDKPGDYEPSEQLIPPLDEANLVESFAINIGQRHDQPSNPEAAQYGLWWHETAQNCPWGIGREAAQAIWSAALGTCTQPERGTGEYQLLLESSLFQWLVEPGRLYRAECPFLWTENPQQWIEGIIDLIAFEPEEGVWHVIDWKTNKNPDSPALAAQYYQQIQAYCKALQSIFRAPVMGSLYLTGSGEWVPLLKLEIAPV